MMDKDNLRKADLFSGGIITLIGIFIVSQALQMPMKDSWGGVQNVWYVSPAIFPLFVGSMIALLGGMLMRTAFRTVGTRGLAQVLGFLYSSGGVAYIKGEGAIRFYAIVILFFSFVFIMIPCIDFFPATILFLLAFISMFYLDHEGLLKKLLRLYISQMGVLVLCMVSGIFERITVVAYPGDLLTLAFIPVFAFFTRAWIKTDPVRMKKFRTGMILAIAAPLLVGASFKYLLMVPMPFEGLVVELMDAVRYYEF